MYIFLAFPSLLPTVKQYALKIDVRRLNCGRSDNISEVTGSDISLQIPISLEAVSFLIDTGITDKQRRHHDLAN